MPEIIQTVHATIQRTSRLIIADFGLESLNFCCWNIRRLADDKIKCQFLRQNREAVFLKKLATFSNAITVGLLPGYNNRSGSNPESTRLGFRAFNRQHYFQT